MQMGFVKSRVISDNIFMVQELAQGIDLKIKYDNTIFKLDISKAYDNIG